MGRVLVRNLDDAVVERLKRRASQNGRSLEGELRHILEQAAEANMTEARRLAGQIRRKLAGRQHSDSAQMLAEDRGR